MVKEHDMLTVLMHQYHSIMLAALKPDPTAITPATSTNTGNADMLIMDIDNEVLQRAKYWKPYIDTRYTITNTCVAQFMLYHNTAPFSMVRAKRERRKMRMRRSKMMVILFDCSCCNVLLSLKGCV